MKHTVLLITFASAVAACHFDAEPSGTVERGLAPAAGPSPSFKGNIDPEMPPLQVWDGKPLPRGQSDNAIIFVSDSPGDPSTALAAEVDGDKVVAFVELPWAAVGEFVDANQTPDPQQQAAAFGGDTLPDAFQVPEYKTTSIKIRKGQPDIDIWKMRILIKAAYAYALVDKSLGW